MPGWYVHSEAAKVTAQRLMSEDVPVNLSFAANEAKTRGEIAQKWRNYLAIGALGPTSSIFFLTSSIRWGMSCCP